MLLSESQQNSLPRSELHVLVLLISQEGCHASSAAMPAPAACFGARSGCSGNVSAADRELKDHILARELLVH